MINLLITRYLYYDDDINMDGQIGSIQTINTPIASDAGLELPQNYALAKSGSSKAKGMLPQTISASIDLQIHSEAFQEPNLRIGGSLYYLPTLWHMHHAAPMVTPTTRG